MTTAHCVRPMGIGMDEEPDTVSPIPPDRLVMIHCQDIGDLGRYYCGVGSSNVRACDLPHGCPKVVYIREGEKA